jgi:hypothetical protein
MEGPTTPGALSSSASFRESDVEFLQDKAREWLEAVLEEKLDPDTSLQDLLADGTILYRVSQIIKEETGHIDGSPAHVLASPEIPRKNSLKYQPYPYVEAFLKVCKEVGLLDVDLFNPSDAIDQKDIRHVCVCLRRLSKKARTLNIQVPDFDNVKHTLTPSSHKHPMSTEAVHHIRDSLQQSSNKPTSRFSTNGDLNKDTSSSIADLRKDDPDVNLEPGSDSVTFEKVHQELDEAAEKRQPIVTEANYTVNVAEPGAEAIPSVSESAGKKNEDFTADNVSEQDSRLATEQLAKARNAESVSESESETNLVRNAGEMRSEEKVSSKTMTFSSPLEEKTQTKLTGEDKKGQFITKPEAQERSDEVKPRKGGFSWLPMVAGVVVFVGAIVAMVVVRERRPSAEVYEVKPGDTLSEISRRSGKSSWQEIVQNNPKIQNPNLIFPSERLNL